MNENQSIAEGQVVIDNQIVVTEEPKQPPSRKLVGVSVDILKTQLGGFYETYIDDKKNDVVKILIRPEAGQEGGMSIHEMIKEINGIIIEFSGGAEVGEEEIKTLLKDFGLGILNGISVKIKQVFLYLTRTEEPKQEEPKETEESKQNDNDVPKITKTVEYAFSFVIENRPVPDGKLGFFRINSVSFSIWNTGREGVLKAMELGTIEELLADLSDGR